MSGYLGYTSPHKQDIGDKYLSKHNGYSPYNSYSTLNRSSYLQSSTATPWLDSLHRRTLRNHDFFLDFKSSFEKVKLISQLICLKANNIQ